MSKKTKKIVCLGGGTGTSVILSGLKKYPLKLTAIVTMFDSGGSSGKLKKALGILPLGDIRQCLISSSTTDAISNPLSYRFGYGKLKGHSVGNLLIDEISRLTGGDLEKAIDELGKNLNIKTKIIPVTLENADIVALLKNNKKIKEEEKIINCRNLSKVGVKKIFLSPEVKANPKAISAIKDADLIIVGPGKFYTTLIPILLTKRIKEAIRKSKAKKVFICNLMTQIGNTDGFSVEKFVEVLEKYLGEGIIDYVIFNTGKPSAALLREVKKVFPKAEFVKYNKDLLKNKNFIGADVLDRKISKTNPADILVKRTNKRTLIFHDSKKLAKIIFSLCPVIQPRTKR